MPSWPIRNLPLDVDVFVSPVKRSGQFKQVWADVIIYKDNYSDIKLYSIFHIEYKAIAFITNKNNQQLQPDPPLNLTFTLVT